MRNQEIAKIFNDMARFLRMERVAFKPYAYERAAMSLESLSEYVGDIYKKGGVKALMEIPGVGKAIADHIEEYLKTGRIKHYEAQKKKLPIDLDGLVRVEGMGARKAKVLYQKLNVKNLKDLEKAAKAHKVASLFGFGEKTEKNILEGIKFLKRSKGRFLLNEILPKTKEVYEKLKNIKGVERVDYCGSLRRMKEPIGDVAFLVAVKESRKPARNASLRLRSDAGRVMDSFVA